jgi:hypothetical protein
MPKLTDIAKKYLIDGLIRRKHAHVLHAGFELISFISWYTIKAKYIFINCDGL